MKKLGIIGFGTRASELMDSFLRLEEMEIVAVCDPNLNTLEIYCTEHGIDRGSIRVFEQPEQMLEECKELDGVIVATRCSLHTEMARLVLAHHMPLFLEKPISTTQQDLRRLQTAAKGAEHRVTVSFPLRLTPLCQRVKQLIEAGTIGRVTQIQAVNNVHYGGVYFHDWYRDTEETGGLFMQKATHDFDYINYLMGDEPVEIGAMTSRQYFVGSHPFDQSCDSCAEKRSCPESPFCLTTCSDEPVRGRMCCFTDACRNEDSSSALIRYRGGAHVVYTQNVQVKKKAGYRGATVIGERGTIRFDWTSDTIQVFMHYSSEVQTYHLPVPRPGHQGGDLALARDFLRVMQGEPSQADLFDGYKSTQMCLAARTSAEEHRFVGLEEGGY